MHSELQPCGCFDFSFSFYCKLFCIYVGVYVIYCFFFFIDYCRVWSTFPCVTQWVLVACFINSCWSVSQLCLILCDPMDCSTQASLSFTVSRSLLKLMSTELVMPFNHLILCRSFSSFLQSFPASGSFLMSWLFPSGDQNVAGRGIPSRA